VSRRDETRAAVLATIAALTADAGSFGLDTGTPWLPADDPHAAATNTA
jgi:hypothetical protein